MLLELSGSPDLELLDWSSLPLTICDDSLPDPFSGQLLILSSSAIESSS